MAGPEREAASLAGRADQQAAPSARLPWPLASLTGLTRIPLYRSSFALVLTTVINAGLGLIFWTLAARLYSTEEVGRAAAAVAALQLVSMLGCTGLTPALVRLIPPSRAGTRRLVLGTYATGVTIAVLAGICVVLATNLGIEPLAVPGYAYLLAIPIFALFTLQDGALIGLRREGLVPVENAAYGVVKIALLVAFSTAGAWGIFVSWSITAFLLVVPVNLLLFLKFIPVHSAREAGAGREFRPGDIVRFAGANHVSGLLMALPDFLMPIIVLQAAGAQENAFFYAAWSLVWPLRLIASNIANAFTAQAAEDDSRARDLLIKAGLLALAIFAPLVVFLIVAAHPLLRYLFGSEYAENGDLAMRLLAPGLLASAFLNLAVAFARVKRQVGRLVFLSVTYTALSLPLSIALVSWQGIDGAGAAWLLSQVAMATIALGVWALGLLRGTTRAEVLDV
jgi:O-antigen/teichoic acid export membrane protein